MKKYSQINKVLLITMFLNLAVALVKLVIGSWFKISALVADGFHSLSDSVNNVIGLVSVYFSRKRNDESHPYGYEKYETIATLLIACLVAILGYRTLVLGIQHLIFNSAIRDFSVVVYWSIIVTIIFNLITVIYEGRQGRKLGSEFLCADAKETKGDILISLTVLLSVFLTQWWPLWRGDAWLTIVISFFIFRNAWSIFNEVLDILTDRNTIDAKIIEAVVLSHPQVKFCHAIRSRGKPDSVFVDLHVGVDNSMTVKQAHDQVGHELKLLLKEKIPGLKSVSIHTEPETAKQRQQSVFKRSDY